MASVIEPSTIHRPHSASAAKSTLTTPVPVSSISGAAKPPAVFARAATASARPVSKPPPSSALSSRPTIARNDLASKSLPSLPAFDVLSFDLASEFESALSGGSGSSKPNSNSDSKPKTDFLQHSTLKQPLVVVEAKEKDDGTTDKAPAPAVTRNPVAPAHSRSRSKSMIDRRRSWLPSSKSSPDVRPSTAQRSKRFSRLTISRTFTDADFVDDAPELKPLERSRTVESFADFAKKSWINTSRSPSPPSKPVRLAGTDGGKGETDDTKAGVKARNSAGKRDTGVGVVSYEAVESASGKNRIPSRASIFFGRIKSISRNSSSVSLSSSVKSSQSSKSTDSDSTAPSTSGAATPTKNSTIEGTDRNISNNITAAAATLGSVTAQNNVSHTSIASSVTPRNSSQASSLNTVTTSENSQATEDTGITMPHPTSRDPLWSVFRKLDADFAEFASKHLTTQRMGVVRSALLPFLHSTAHHPSNSNRAILSSEDFDRRATILNKWWIGLLEMLDAGQSRSGVSAFTLAANHGVTGVKPSAAAANLQPVPGVERPTLLETITMLMMRPEWRACTSYFQPLAERSPEERVRARSGTQSTIGDDNSDSSSFINQSAEHNIRTMFVNNLLTQMAFAVDRMSLNHAPLSLVNWCGKACAYAFFFVPGIADVLVRLWVLNGEILRRVADEFGLPRRSKGESDDIVALFPPHLGKLGWTSGKTLSDKLRLATKLPLMTAKIPWHGPWGPRWRGGDTDLFYIFCKYYHILAEEFMPPGLPLLEKARAPAFVLVHAQLLSVLDSTIHRQASIDALLGPPLADAPHGSDAMLAGLPLSSNLLKGMGESRLVILLKDMLSESSNIPSAIRHTFAEAFMGVTTAATKRTSRFDHNACFVLCDFLEEVLVLIDTYQNTLNNSIATSPTEESAPESPLFDMSLTPRTVEFIDWAFWCDVGKMIMDSNNTMSEIRIISFIFSMWDAITADPVRKEELCLGWLLTEETFAKFFNHWCPMVRAYYMRLLCWRLCRDTGSPNELDA